MATKQIELPHIGSVTLYKRKGTRSLRLSIGADGKIRVSMPTWLPYKVGEQFVLTKSAWIAERHTSTVVLTHGQQIGKHHQLLFESSPSHATPKASRRATQIVVKHPPSFEEHHPALQSVAQKACIRALRTEAEQLLPSRLQDMSRRTGLEYGSVVIKQMRSRWGSCNSERDIVLNLFLMQLPWHLIDYVIVHELTHTKVMRHGAPFWAEIERHLPNAKQLRAEMAAHRPTLLADQQA